MAANTMIFGPTGGVASYALQYAASKGAQVTLAMRDPSKSIPNLTSSQESNGSFKRVKADLTDAESVKEAAKGAHSAFIYLVPGPHGTPRSSIQALKDAGVKHVVFLSSYSVQDPPSSNPQSEIIPWAHAQVELALTDIFGEGNHTSVRPAFFASNTFRYASQIKAGVVKEINPQNVADFIAPRDIGEVVGSLLLHEDSLPSVVELAGQQTIPLEEAFHSIAKANGRTIRVENLTEEQGVKGMLDQGLPPPIAKYLARHQAHSEKWQRDFRGERFESAQKTVKELLGRDGLTFEQWLEENKQVFA